ncbi:MAG: PEGA domain-containing protein [Chitinivibrionia bacterium]|nr:PEGA domain-containing protein [Chitinivibrionia bacterium]
MRKKLFLSIIFCFAFSFAQVEQTDETATEETPVIETAAQEKTRAQENIDDISQDEAEAQESEISDAETSLTILTKPDSATILVNRKKSGLTPFFASGLEPQEYNIMLLKDGYELFDTTINLSAGQKDTILVNLVSENQKAGNVEAKSATTSKTRKTTNIKEEKEDKESDEQEEANAEATEEKKKKMDRIGIIVFLSVMIILMGMQEAGNR